MSFEQGFYVFVAVSSLAVVILCAIFERAERKHRRERQHPIFKQDEQENWK